MRQSLRVLMVAGLLASFVPLLPSGSALAGDAVVTTCTEAGFDAALAAAQIGGGGTISFDCGGPATITFTGEKTIAAPNSVVIDGAQQITLDGQDATHFFAVNDGATLTVRGLTFVNGHSASYGGAIVNRGTLAVEASAFSGNSANNGGGAIDSGAHALSVTGSTFTANSTNGNGGAISLFAGGEATIIASSFVDNTSSGDGGAIDSLNPLTIEETTFRGNISGSNGGAISNRSYVVGIASSSFTDNEAAFFGGGVFASNGADILSSRFEGNSAEVGGGLWNNRSASIMDSTFAQNTSVDGSGGAIKHYTGLMEISASTFEGNEASTVGGALEIEDGTLVVALSTFSGNHAETNGAAIANSGQTEIVASTISGNSTVAPGYQIHNDGGTATIAGSIVADGPPGTDNCNGAAVQSLGSNLSDDDSCDFFQPTDIQNSGNVALGPLQNNGGPTATMLPATDSDAVDTSACLTSTDQRGYTRPSGAGCDIGAVELQQAATSTLCASYYTGQVLSPRSGQCGPGTYELAVPDAGPLAFCIDPYTGRVSYSFGRLCAPPRQMHVVPNDGDLLTCVNIYTGAHRHVYNHSQCLPAEYPNLIPAEAYGQSR